MVDTTQYKKFIGTYNVISFKDDGSDMLLDDTHCVFLAKDINFAKYLAVYSMIEDLKFCGVAVKSIELVEVCEVSDDIKS